MEEVLQSEMAPGQRFAGVGLSTGSAGTIACGDYLRKKFPLMKVCASEALECPTLLNNGYGAHRIEGIGDKHVPWVHNVRNTDLVCAINDEDPVRIIRLFNEPAGKEFLKQAGVPAATVDNLHLLGISGVCNLLTCIKMARFYEMDENDVLFTILTDSMELYGSRLEELREERGEYAPAEAAADLSSCLLRQRPDSMQELTYWDRKRVHNLKYFTWVEQQGMTVEELNAQWFDRGYWDRQLGQAAQLDAEIRAFNEKVGLSS
jgi:hypothetical protein